MNYDNDFGFTTVKHVSTDDIESAEKRLQQVKDLVLPLLENLMINPHMDIHWPKRDKTIGEFKKKLLAIIDGPSDGPSE